MKAGRSRGFVSAIIVILAVAWLVAANHCALATVQNSAEPAAEHSRCHSEKEESEPLGHSKLCCAALAAPLPHALAAPAIHLRELQPAWSSQAVRDQASPDQPVLVVDFAGDTGPPQHSLNFALLVLNRSLFSHAPPRVLA
jgi:hypothetical protein